MTYACKSDVFKGDIITVNKKHYAVVDSMNSNNGNFKANDSKGLIVWLNTVKDSIRIERRKDNTIIYV